MRQRRWSDEGTRVLAEDAPAFAHLERLDVSQNTLTDEGLRQVARLGPNVRAGDQRDFEEDDRYVSVGDQARRPGAPPVSSRWPGTTTPGWSGRRRR